MSTRDEISCANDRGRFAIRAFGNVTFEKMADTVENSLDMDWPEKIIWKN